MPTSTAVSPFPVRRERRAHVRHGVADLPSIRETHLQKGPLVSLVDLSVGGALIEAKVQLKPGARLSLVIAPEHGAPSLVTMRVLRCEVATVRPEVTVYRGGCEFTRRLEWPALLSESIASVLPTPPARLDASLKLLAERCRAGSSDGSLKTADILAVLNSLHARAIQLDDQLAGPIGDLLPTIATALERRDPAETVLGEIEAQLRAALPRANIRLTPTALPAESGTESIIFRPEHATDLACVLNVQLPDGATLADWQFRLLRASMHLCSLIDAAGIRSGIDAPGAANWQEIAVRYKDGRLVKGFSRDFDPSRLKFTIWPSIGAPESDGMMVPLSGLKAVFFVKELGGDAAYGEDPTFEPGVQGRRLEATFFDNDVLVGTTLSYRPDGPGFFLSPADPRAANLRVFVVRSAVRHVRFLGPTTDAPAGTLKLAVG